MPTEIKRLIHEQSETFSKDRKYIKKDQTETFNAVTIQIIKQVLSLEKFKSRLNQRAEQRTVKLRTRHWKIQGVKF